MTGSFPHLHAANPKTALVEGGVQRSYADLCRRIDSVAAGLLGAGAGRGDLEEERVATFLPASLDYVASLHGIWRAGGVAVPLNVASAAGELEHYLSAAGVTRLIAAPASHVALRGVCEALGVALLTPDDVVAAAAAAAPTLPVVADTRRAMMLFTSGTTAKPKGVVTTHRIVAAQVTALVDAWAWAADDVIPLFLPLHHIHGIINVLSCALWAGATVELFPKFDAGAVARRAADKAYTICMAVPTVYVKFLQFFESVEDADERARLCAGFKSMRLNVSGSAACPVKLFEQWREATGQVLLERYGMTEIGMGLSNPYVGERRAGCVGRPLPGVEVALVDEAGRFVNAEGTPGEIRVKGPAVFLEYWNDAAATRAGFDNDGWFCTGDFAVIEDGAYRIMGRASVDIIKSGGYKLSALEIEGALLAHPSIREVAVVGVPDDTWGEAVVACAVLTGGAPPLTLAVLKAWCAGRLSSYKIPKAFEVVDTLPRNAMGKVTKPALKALLVSR